MSTKKLKFVEEGTDKEQYAARVAPYYPPHGLVFVFSGITRERWKKKRIIDVRKWAGRHKNVDVYSSVQQYRIGAKRYDNDHEEPYFAPIYFDFDASDKHGTKVEDAQNDTIRLCEKLSNAIDLDPTTLRIWFSGSRGFHVTIDARICGLNPSNRLHLLYKNIALYYKDLLDLKTLDDAVYSIKRQWRIPNSKRKKKITLDGEEVEQHKVELTLSELSLFTMDEIRKLAIKPRESQVDESVSLTHTKAGREWIKKFVDEFDAEDVLESSKVDGSLVIPKDNKSLPVCMQAVMAYKIGAEKRYVASLTISTFFKALGVTREKALQKLEEWVTNIPWDTGKLRERIANARSHIHTVYGTKSRYTFSCAFVRSLKGRHYTGQDVTIPCQYKKCPYISDEDDGVKKDEKPIELELFDTIKPDYFGKIVSVPAHVVAFTDRAYSVPIRVMAKCPHVPDDDETHAEICNDCGMPRFADNIEEGGECRGSETLRRTVILREKHFLSFIDISSKAKKQIIRALSSINSKCTRWSYVETKTGTLRQLFLRSTLSPQFDPTHISWDKEKGGDVENQAAFVVNEPGSDFFVDRNLDVKLECVPVSNDRNQTIHLAIRKADDGYSELSRFQMTEHLYDQLQAFQPKPGQTVQEKIEERVDYMSNNVTFIRKRGEMYLAYDLVYHSPLWLKLSKSEEVVRGWLQLLVIGDPGQGKSLIGKRLMKHYQLGRMMDGATTTRTGLTYTIRIQKNSSLLIWGALPQEDRRLVMIDEAHQVSQEHIANMTKMRDDGELLVAMTVSGSTWARTRLVFIANPKGEGILDDYGMGPQALIKIFPRQQDVRRLDMALLCRSGDVNEDDINALNVFNKSDVYSSSACRNLVLWAWTRGHQHIRWADEAIKLLMSESTKLSRFFKCDIAIVEGADMRYRLGRIAQAVAAIIFSTDEKGEQLWVKEDHVKFASEFFYRLMTTTGQMGLDVYADTWQTRIKMGKGEKEELSKLFSDRDPYLAEKCTKILMMDELTKGMVNEMLNMDSEVFRELWAYLVRKSMVEAIGKAMYRVTPKFKKWLLGKAQKLRTPRDDFDLPVD